VRVCRFTGPVFNGTTSVAIGFIQSKHQCPGNNGDTAFNLSHIYPRQRPVVRHEEYPSIASGALPVARYRGRCFSAPQRIQPPNYPNRVWYQSVTVRLVLGHSNRIPNRACCKRWKRHKLYLSKCEMYLQQCGNSWHAIRLYAGAMTGASTKWAFYSVSAPSFFGGNGQVRHQFHRRYSVCSGGKQLPATIAPRIHLGQP